MTLTPKTYAVLMALRAHSDTGNVETHANGRVFASVYLDNAKLEGMTARSFAGHLAALADAGLYMSQGDDSFGMVDVGGDQ